MKGLLFFFILLTNSAFGQNVFKAIIKDDNNKQILLGVSAIIDSLQLGSLSDEKELLIISNIPDGKFEIKFSFAGYRSKKQAFVFPLAKPDEVFEIELEPNPGELDEVVVQTTRSSRSIKNIPTRLEVLTADELQEEGTIKPGEIKKLLKESTGITTQQTSAVSGNANLRIQGLDGRYTQLLKDGMPLYQGFSGGLSILQIAPLDLKQVEFIKGSASTLYGGGAIAGLINLISKTPGQKRELSFLMNGTSAKGFDGNIFYSQKFKKIGTTFFGAYNFNAPYDPANTGFTAIPKTNRFTINPKLFLYLNKKTSAWFGINTTYEDRFGGDLEVIKGKADRIHQFYERNKTFRLSTQFSFTHIINAASKINFKNSVGFFSRKLLQPNINFNAQQVSSFSEFNYSHNKQKSEWVVGVNIWTDDFSSPGTSNLNYHLSTIGAFSQNTFKANNWFSLETGLRIDKNSPATNDKLKGIFILPRMNGLFKINQQLTSRIGGGLGLKMPSPFSDEAEEKGYQNINPFSLNNIHAEKSYGGNADITFSKKSDEFSFSINQLFFYTYLDKPLILQVDNFINANGHIDTKGAETNLKIIIDDISFFVGYAYTDTRQHFNGQNSWQPLTARHRLFADVIYDKENNFRAGIETYYVSKQQLSDGSTGKPFTTFGFLFEKMWEHINIFFNAENFTDCRQTRWGSIYTGTITNPTFRDIYAPTEGIIINAGIKLKL